LSFDPKIGAQKIDWPQSIPDVSQQDKRVRAAEKRKTQ